jgi:hypothetical protein
MRCSGSALNGNGLHSSIAFIGMPAARLCPVA